VFKNKIQTEERTIKRIDTEINKYTSKKKEQNTKEKFLQTQLEEQKLIYMRLQSEKEENQNKLNLREKELYKYKDNIKDLQKTKQVLTHRTQEMQASLEPKS
jgi:chromosome segregation ATPase